MNGIDKDLINASPNKYNQVGQKTLLVVYAGNIGDKVYIKLFLILGKSLKAA